MALFESGNPALSEKKFSSTVIPDVLHVDEATTMTVKGSLQKFGFLLLLVLGTSFYSWKQFAEGGAIQGMLLTGLIGGIVAAIVIIFKQEWSPYLAPVYALMQGLFLGAISAMFNAAFAEKAPNIVFNAIGSTLAVAVAMYLLFSFKIIKATEKFKSIIIAATVGIGVFYLIVMVVRMFGVDMPFLHEGSAMGIGFSLIVTAVAALNLILDFDMIEKGSELGAPKYMEWYGAFGLLVTIIWLYMEILKLLAKINRR